MGYTHYWRLDKKKLSKTAFENVAYDMTRIEQAMSKQGVRLGGWDEASEEMHDENPNQLYFRLEAYAILHILKAKK